MNQGNEQMFMFFNLDPTALDDGNKKVAEKEIEEKLKSIINSMAILYEIIPKGRSVVLEIPLSRLKLPKGVGEFGYLIVTRPDGILNLSTQ